MCLFAVATSFIISGRVYYEHNKMLKLTHFKNLYSFFCKEKSVQNKDVTRFVDALSLCLAKYELHLLQPVYIAILFSPYHGNYLLPTTITGFQHHSS
jgi:hypothetical protein